MQYVTSFLHINKIKFLNYMPQIKCEIMLFATRTIHIYKLSAAYDCA